MRQELIIEKLSGHDTTGVVGKIQKKAGDSIKVGDVLFSIESGKGALAYKSQWEGKLTELGISEGDKVSKGQVVGSVESAQGEHPNDGAASSSISSNLSNLTSKNTEKQTYSFGISKPQKKTIEADILIIGGGPGGYVAAIRGAQAGKTVAIIEEDRLGGTCLNYGCIPTKAMASSVSVLHNVKAASIHGIDVTDFKIDFKKLMNRKNEVVNQLVGGIEHLMDSHGITYVRGTALVEPEGGIRVKNKKEDIQFVYKHLILAMGSSPCSLPIPGNDMPDILTSRELLSLEQVPKSLTIIGGGVIGMEFAFIYRALGAEVNVVEYFPQILNMLDADVAAVVRNSALEKGIRIFEGACAAEIKKTLDGSKLLEIQIGEERFSICSEKIAMAVGRKANLNSLDLGILGVELNDKKNGIQVDEYLQTSASGVYAIGDVTNIIQLAHVASHQGITAVDHICGKLNPMRYDQIPSAIFTDPEIGHVGLTEKEAAEAGIEILTGKFPFMANGKALAMGEADGFVKVIANAKDRKIIGGTIVGVHATDLMATVGNLIAKETLIDEATHVVYAHPTTAESIHEALLMLDGKGIHFA